MPIWFVIALATAVVWGISYSIDEYLVKTHISPPFLCFITAILSAPIYAGIALYQKNFVPSWKNLTQNHDAMLAFGVVFVCGFFASLGILESIRLKNATLSSMIEITYPLFTALFAWLFFKDVQINSFTWIGFLFVLIGVFIIQKTS